MTPERWKLLEELFAEAMDLDHSRRSSFVSEKCAGDEELADKLNDLLSVESHAAEFIESSIWMDSEILDTRAKAVLSTSFDDALGGAETDGVLGQSIGHFVLKKELGRGGMGAVFLAERSDGEFEQKVAIKLIKRGMDSDFVIKRFRHERQILASFEHPFIARLIDGGTRDDGTPYFIMEYVAGSTLYDHCDERRLTLNERLTLFAKICSAVDYAHQRKIVHRDIKPSNILVNVDGDPKLLDFGIAKVLDNDLIDDSVNPTGSMLRLMTPDYASPEQVKGLEITGSSDIYSLGILLYELLSGHRPFNLNAKALHEITYSICEEEPLPPSRSVSLPSNLLPRYSKSSLSFSQARAIDTQDLIDALAGNLDNIVMKAIAKEPSERYPSVAAMLSDISIHLSGKEVNAEDSYLRTTRSSIFNQPARANARTLAVLPFLFTNLTNEATTGDKFLGIGIADALIMRLSKIGRLVVRPTNAVLSLDPSSIDAEIAGRELGVEFILTGNIKKADNRLRVSVQLLKVAENSIVWATSIDDELSDVFSLEDKLSTKVAEALLPQLTGRELADLAKRVTNDPEAYEHYVRGKYHFNSFTEDGLAQAFLSFHSAISADPEYALAHAGLAEYYCWLGIMGVLQPAECFTPAIEFARKAVAIDSDSSEAHAALGFALHAGMYERNESERHLRKAIVLNPGNAKASVWLSIVLFSQGRFNEGLAFANEGLELDPLTPFNHHNLGWGLYFARRFAESTDQYRRVIANFPEYSLGYFGLSKVLRFTGQTEEAIRYSQKNYEIMDGSIYSRFALAESLAADRQVEEALSEFASLDEISKERYIPAYFGALFYCQLAKLGDTHRSKYIDLALDRLEDAADNQEPWLNWLPVEPVLDQLRSTPRFLSIANRTGLFLVSNYERPVSTNDELHRSQTTGVHERETIRISPEKGPDTSSFRSLANRFAPKIKMAAAVMLGLLLVASIAVYLTVPISFTASFSPDRPQTNFRRPSMIVIPFRSSDRANIGIGLADALSQRLGVVNGLEVISANTARTLSIEQPIKGAADLNVSFVLTGVIDSDGDNVYLDAALADVSTGVPIWKERLRAANGDYFDLQKQAAINSLNAMGIDPQPNELKNIERVSTTSLSAYEKFLIGRSQLATRNAQGLRNAITSFSEAIAEDGQFALAYVGLADSYSLLNLYDIAPPADAYAQARRYAERALAIDNELAEAHASLGYILFFGERDRSSAELEFRRAVQMNPSYAQAHHWFALALAAMKKSDDAKAEIAAAERLDPRSLSVISAAAMVLFFDGKFEQAIAKADFALAIDPNFVPALKVKRWVYSAMGNNAMARELLDPERLYSGGAKGDPSWTIIEAQVVDRAKDGPATLALLEKAIEIESIKGNDRAFAFEIALAFAHLGEYSRALEHLEKAERAGSHSFNLMDADPRLNILRTEAQFQKLLEKLRTPIRRLPY